MVRPNGGTVELSQLANIRVEDGPVQIIREGGQRFATVLTNVRGRDLVGFVAEAQAAVERQRQAARETIRSSGAASSRTSSAPRRACGWWCRSRSAMIFLLLYLTFGSVRQAVLVFCNVPFATIGGVIALWASGLFLSVPASVGFIALIGIAVLNGVVLVSYINESVAKGDRLFRDAIMEGAKRRLRPVTLTASIAALGLVPFLFASGPGSEIQKPLAIVVIGGLVTATLLTLFLLPILYDHFALPRAERIKVDEFIREKEAVEAAEAAAVAARTVPAQAAE